MAKLLRLPDELLCMVVDFCDHISDLRSLSATCRQFHEVFNPFLYKRAANCYPHLLPWACDTSQVSLVKKLLAAGADPNTPCVASAPREDANYSRRIPGLRIVPMPKDLLKGTYNHRKLPRGLITRAQVVTYFTPVAENEDDDDEWYDDTFRVFKDDGITYYRVDLVMPHGGALHRTRFPQNPKIWSHISGQGHFWFPLQLTPRSAAARAGSLEITKLLVESGALLEPPSLGFCDCLAYMSGEKESGTERWIPLHTAICCGNDSVALYLISKGSSIWLNEYHTITAMHQAAEMGHLPILEALLAKDPKLDVNLKEASQKTPMMYAHGGKQSTETILWLLEHGADPNASIDENGISLLQAACIFGRFQLAKAYIRAGADCNKKWRRPLEEALTPLERCCIVTSAATGPSIKCTNNRLGKVSPEKDAYSRAPDSDDDRLELIALMIQKGVEIRRSKPEEGSFEPSPMVFAAENHLISVMEILIKAGAGAGDIDHRKKFPICAAFHHEYIPETRFIPEKPPPDLQTPRTVAWLLEHGADINQRSDAHHALHCLCDRRGYQTAEQAASQLELGRWLIDKGADVDSKGQDDLPVSESHSSATEAAFGRGRLSLCDLLIQKGAEFPQGADSLVTLFEELLSNHRPIYGSERYVPSLYDNEEDVFRTFGSIRWRSWSDDEKLENLTSLRRKVCDGLDSLILHDKHQLFVKHPRSLWVASSLPELPLVDKLLEAGASDASWVENGRSCLHQLLQHHSNSLSHNARQFIALGARPSQSLLYKAIAGEKPRRYQVEEFVWEEPESQPDWDLIRFFFSQGAKLDLNNPPPDYRRNTNPLILIIRKLSEEEDYDNFELILKSLSEPLSPEQGFDCLTMATYNPVHPRPVKALMEAGVDINYWPSGGRSTLAHLVGTFEGLHYDFDPFTRIADLGSSDEMVDTLKLLLEAGARLGPWDLSTSEMRDIYQRIRHVADIAWDEQVWSVMLHQEAQEDARNFFDNMGESLCRLSFKGGKIVIKNRGELGPEDVNSNDEDEDTEVESQDEESDFGEDE